MAFNKELADDASSLRVREAKKLGALFLITACPFCERSFRSAQEKDEGLAGIVVVNLVDFVAEFVE